MVDSRRMKIQFNDSVSSLIGSFQNGKTYDVNDEAAAEFIKAKIAVAVEAKKAEDDKAADKAKSDKSNK
jgi:hypothetical protein